MINAVIVDDEKDAVKGLSLLLKTYCADVKLVATANSVADGVKAIKAYNPDIVFLDVEMPGGSGFDILKNLPEVNFKTIFISAFNQYAIKAIKFSALDYLLKPVDPEELCAAVDKVRNNSVRNEKDQREILLQNLSSGKMQKLAVPIKDGFQYISISQIIRIEGAGSYCIFHLQERKKIMASQNLGIYYDLLSKYNFYRTHQSHLINVEHIHQFLRTDGGVVIMSDKSRVPVSRRNRDEFCKIASHSK